MKRYPSQRACSPQWHVPGLNAQTVDLKARFPLISDGRELMPAGDYWVHHASSVVIVRRQAGFFYPAMSLTAPGIAS